MKGKKGDDIIQMTTTWPSTVPEKMIFLRSNKWSISSQYDAGRNVSERICSIDIHLISDYDSITLNIGVIRYNDQQPKKEKPQLFKLRENLHF